MVLGNFKFIFTTKRFRNKNCFLRTFYAINKPFSQKERWMPNLRQQIARRSAVGQFDRAFHK
jgi:hypothetical protein